MIAIALSKASIAGAYLNKNDKVSELENEKLNCNNGDFGEKSSSRKNTKKQQQETGKKYRSLKKVQKYFRIKTD